MNPTQIFLLIIGSMVAGAFCYKLGKDFTMTHISKFIQETFPDKPVVKLENEINQELKRIETANIEKIDKLCNSLMTDMYKNIIDDINQQLRDLYDKVLADSKKIVEDELRRNNK